MVEWGDIGRLVVRAVVWRSGLLQVRLEASFGGQLDYHVEGGAPSGPDTSPEEADDVLVSSDLLHGHHLLDQVFELRVRVTLLEHLDGAGHILLLLVTVQPLTLVTAVVVIVVVTPGEIDVAVAPSQGLHGPRVQVVVKTLVFISL